MKVIAIMLKIEIKGQFPFFATMKNLVICGEFPCNWNYNSGTKNITLITSKHDSEAGGILKDRYLCPI